MVVSIVIAVYLELSFLLNLDLFSVLLFFRQGNQVAYSSRKSATQMNFAGSEILGSVLEWRLCVF